MQADLFNNSQTQTLQGTPLAEQLRPRSLEEILGQQRAIGAKTSFAQLIARDQIPNTIIWGPPGCGKTTLARLLATHTQSTYLALSAISTGAKELRQIGEDASANRRLYGKRTLVFIDEIHRLNKAQQDVLLPFVESGDFTLVGATTENPAYELNRALLSRCHLLVFERLSGEALLALAQRAVPEQSLEKFFHKDAQDYLIQFADGDARRLLNSLELALSAKELPLSREILQEILGQRPLHYDKNSDQHYDLISAFIKSVRGSDPQASVYYLARMLEGGEDPLFIARRLVILSSEDIGNADPKALPLATAALHATELIGLPEARIPLAQCTLYLACAPKSNSSYLAIDAALEEVKKSGSLPVPLDLRSSQTAPMKSIGYGKNYNYPHNHPKGWVQQPYLPRELAEAKFYEPKNLGFEKQISAYLEWLKTP